MSKYKHTPSGRALTDLVLELFRLNNRLLAAGDRLVAGIGLTSARWKVLGTISTAERPQPVAWLARDMGGNRQNVQRIVNDLEGRLGGISAEPPSQESSVGCAQRSGETRLRRRHASSGAVDQ